MQFNKVCTSAQPGHVRFLDNRRVFPVENRKIYPVVVSPKRFEGIMGRARMEKKAAAAAQAEEDKRYLQYLKDGSDWLCSHFTNVGAQSLDEEKQAKLDQELLEGEIRAKQVKMEDDITRKKRIIRANRILEDLKPGQRALHHAVIESEMASQRRFNEAVNREIIKDGERQRAIEDALCPETLVPLNRITEEQLKAEQTARAIAIRADFLKDIEERRERKKLQDEEDVCETLIERAQYQCLYEKELKEFKERQAKKREFCRKAYRDALKEKAAIKEYERIRDQINDRVICVDVTRRRNLDKRYNKEYKAFRAKQIKDREDRAIALCRILQAAERKAASHQITIEDRYEAEVEMDEARRQCLKEELSKQRRAYEIEERKQIEERRKREAQIHRFQVAERLKNMESNKKFFTRQKQMRDRATANLRDILHGQRDEFLRQRQEEKMRISACQEDPYIKEDVQFFEDAKDAMVIAKKEGRPVYPIAKAVEIYRRQNQIDSVPEGRMVGRSKIRDYCWPGYFSKADLAYRNYEAREDCRKELERERHKIFENCIKITKMAAEEAPYQKCEIECPYKCFQHRGMPAVESIDSFDCACVCIEDEPPLGACGPSMQGLHAERQPKPKVFPKIEPYCRKDIPRDPPPPRISSLLKIVVNPEPEQHKKCIPKSSPKEGRKAVWR